MNVSVWTRGESGWAENTVEVRHGDRVRLTWCGGNGPHEYTVAERCGDLFALVHADEPIDPVRCLTKPLAVQALAVIQPSKREEISR